MITTIITTYRRPKLLKRALLSALNQTYADIEVHVFDNASGDETGAVVREFMERDCRVKYHCHPHNLGMMGNYLESLSHVETPYFSFLSDDDVLLPWFYEEAMRGFSAFPECGFSAASVLILSEKGAVVRVPLDLWKRQGYFAAGEAPLDMISKYPVPTCVLFDRKVIAEVPIDVENVLMWDCDFLLRIAMRYPVFISKRPCGIFLHHGHSYSNAQELECWKAAQQRICARMQQLGRFSEEDKKRIREAIAKDIEGAHRAFILLSVFRKRSVEACGYALSFHKNYGPSRQTLLFMAAAYLCRFFPPTRTALICLRWLKKLGKKRRNHSFKEYLSIP